MPPNKVYLDTGGWIALLNASDSLHHEAVAIWSKLGTKGYSVLLTDWIVAETGNGLARTNARNRFAEVVRMLRASSHAKIITVSESLLNRALALYENRNDKNWGLVDCSSFLVMQDNAVSEAFTNDRHFEQAGFRCLLALH